jgi:hypothetical protein
MVAFPFRKDRLSLVATCSTLVANARHTTRRRPTSSAAAEHDLMVKPDKPQLSTDGLGRDRKLADHQAFQKRPKERFTPDKQRFDVLAITRHVYPEFDVKHLQLQSRPRHRNLHYIGIALYFEQLRK